jgi:hypothetical protein
MWLSSGMPMKKQLIPDRKADPDGWQNAVLNDKSATPIGTMADHSARSPRRKDTSINLREAPDCERASDPAAEFR